MEKLYKLTVDGFTFDGYKTIKQAVDNFKVLKAGANVKQKKAIVDSYNAELCPTCNKLIAVEYMDNSECYGCSESRADVELDYRDYEPYMTEDDDRLDLSELCYK